jgi:hypothetical protein
VVKPIAQLVDISFPSVYTYSADRMVWLKSLHAQVAEARRLFDGPVYVFLWPQYFDHEPADADLRLQYIDGDFWRFQLDEVKKVADGVVIWGGWDFSKGRPAIWVPTAPWWESTKAFVTDIGLKWGQRSQEGGNSTSP